MNFYTLLIRFLVCNHHQLFVLFKSLLQNYFLVTSLFIVSITLIILYYNLKSIDSFLPFKVANRQELYDDFKLLKLIEILRIKNHFLTICCVIIYVVNPILIFITFRYFSWNVSSDLLLRSFSLHLLSIPKVVLVIVLFILSLVYYYKIIQILFYPHVIRFHIYMACRCRDLSKHKLNNLYYEFHSYIHFVYNEIIKYYIFKFITYICNGNYSGHPIKFKILCFIEYKLIYQVFKFIPSTMLILIFLYEIYTRNFYYWKYVLVFYFICKIVSQFRNFYYKTSRDIDDAIGNYFYDPSPDDDPCPEKCIMQVSVQDDFFYKETYFARELLSKNENVYITREHVIEYICNDFNDPFEAEQYSHNNDKKRSLVLKGVQKIFILLIGCCLLLTVFKNKYLLFLTFHEIQIQLPIIILILPTIIILFYVIYSIYVSFQPEIAYTSSPQIVNNLLVKTLIIMQSILFIIMFFKNRYLICPNELILNLKYIQIIEVINLNEKLDLILPYIKLIFDQQIFNINNKIYFLNELLSLPLHFIENVDRLSICDLRTYVKVVFSAINDLHIKHLSNQMLLINELSNEIITPTKDNKFLDFILNSLVLLGCCQFFLYGLPKYLLINFFQDKAISFMQAALLDLQISGALTCLMNKNEFHDLIMGLTKELLKSDYPALRILIGY